MEDVVVLMQWSECICLLHWCKEQSSWSITVVDRNTSPLVVPTLPADEPNLTSLTCGQHRRGKSQMHSISCPLNRGNLIFSWKPRLSLLLPSSILENNGISYLKQSALGMQPDIVYVFLWVSLWKNKADWMMEINWVTLTSD